MVRQPRRRWQPDEQGGQYPDEHAGEQAEGEQGEGEVVRGDVGVGGVAGQVEPGDDRGHPGAGQSGKDHGQAEGPDEDLGSEEGATERDVVDAGQAGPAPAGHEQPALLGGQAEPAGQD